MKRIVLAVLVLVVPAVPACQSHGWCTFAASMSVAVHEYAASKLGPLAGSSRSYGSLYRECVDGDQSDGYEDDPLFAPAAFHPSSPSGDICAEPHEDVKDPCPACVLAHCCTEMVNCVNDYACTCKLARQTPGVDWPEEATCEESSPLADDTSACLAAHCKAECQP